MTKNSPAFCVPLGDFFGLGNEIVNSYDNETSSVAYWYQLEPHKPFGILPIQQRKPVLKGEDGGWLINEIAQTQQAEPMLNDEMKQLKAQWVVKQKTEA